MFAGFLATSLSIWIISFPQTLHYSAKILSDVFTTNKSSRSLLVFKIGVLKTFRKIHRWSLQLSFFIVYKNLLAKLTKQTPTQLFSLEFFKNLWEHLFHNTHSARLLPNVWKTGALIENSITFITRCKALQRQFGPRLGCYM